MTEFSELGLSSTTLQAVADTGYTTATPIQAQAIPVALAGRDVLGIAQTGTGKTAAFTLPMIDRLSAGRSKARMPRALVLAPTRELADQVASSFEKYAKGTKLSWALLIGGVSMGDQVAALDKGVDVLIATPGRLLDLFERGKMLLTGVQLMVVDEADRMLDMGFIPDIERIFKLTPPSRQTLFFSATMPPEITRLTTQFLKDPTRIEATRPATTADTIAQHIANIPSVDPRAKRMALRALIERSEIKNGIVFCNRKSEVDVVAKSLKKHGFDAAAIHGDLDQSVRMKTLASFRAGELKLLVASDVAARGLDIPDVSHVFNYDVPHHADDYVHRIGRTGRAGRSGEAFMIVTPADAKSLDKVLKLTKKTPDEVTLDLDWSQAGGSGGDRRGRSGRPERGERPERAERGERGRGRRAEAREEAPEAERPERPERPERNEPKADRREPKPERREREPARAERRPEKAEARPERHERSERQERQERPAPSSPRPERDRDRERGRYRDDLGPRVVGFGGDGVPAFLQRAAPVKKAT
ncbi:DEAD/DEAH box helicase [Caulobacter sp. 17J65-9]|uniref:DEAD/DEAH box helicase n=1 Tax=Caulobacter sp. 17J65-9 TaxID=2709382 RepID=UPI0013C6FDFD|nr:DEAD/DEAH box helicase [Caulobacter sp. 17J65-9]NEX92936.1 DEAD/DEAH box helicase [Caulobacter sp. 17J65-9]